MLALALTGLVTGGCSFSYQLGSLFGKEEEKPPAPASAPEVTGTIRPKSEKSSEKAGDKSGERSSDIRAPGSKFTESDLVVASQVAAAMLAKGEKDASAPWQNPETGARGMVTPIALSYTQDGFTCRDFLASYVRETVEGWLQGEACRVHHGKWVVRSLKPWKKA